MANNAKRLSPDETWDADSIKAKAAAEAAGWAHRGINFVHSMGGRYLAKDIDGWIDLCANEGIEWEPADAIHGE